MARSGVKVEQKHIWLPTLNDWVLNCAKCGIRWCRKPFLDTEHSKPAELAHGYNHADGSFTKLAGLCIGPQPTGFTTPYPHIDEMDFKECWEVARQLDSNIDKGWNTTSDRSLRQAVIALARRVRWLEEDRRLTTEPLIQDSIPLS